MRMRPIALLLGATLLAGVYAQQKSSSPTAKPKSSPTDSDPPPRSPSGGHTTHFIQVGANGYSIEPNRTKAEVGDTIEWRFYSGEHWIIRGILEHPCVPSQYIMEGWTGLSSGEMKVDKDSDEVPVFRARVNSTVPILFYSGAKGACVDHGMMGVINPQRNINLANYKLRAKDVDYQLRPGDPWPEDEELPTRTASTIPTPTDDATEETSTTPAEDDNTNDDSGGLSTGAIVGMALGGTATLIILGLAMFYCGRRGGVKILLTRETRPVKQPPPFEGPAPVRPPRTPDTENWKPAMDYHRYAVLKTASPEVSMYQQSLPASSSYKGNGSRTYLTVPVATPPATFEQRHVSPYYDANWKNVNPTRPPWMDVQCSRTSAAPVELPSSSDPGNSPLPQY